MKFDDASWHYGGDFPEGLDPSAGATHIAMFLAWAAFRDLLSEIHTDLSSGELERLRSRTVTPTQWFMHNCDGKFLDEDLNEEGNLFAKSYYDTSEAEKPSGSYLEDYERTFPNTASLYEIPDNWETFDRLAPMIDQRFVQWRAKVTSSG